MGLLLFNEDLSYTESFITIHSHVVNVCREGQIFPSQKMPKQWPSAKRLVITYLRSY